MATPDELEAFVPRYPMRLDAWFEDRRGRDPLVITTDGARLRAVLRGAELDGIDFDGLEAERNSTPHPFDTNAFGELDGGSIDFVLPMAVEIDGDVARATLRIRIDLEPKYESVSMELLVNGMDPILGRNDSGLFELALDQIDRALPAGVSMLCCFTCGLSDYNPLGQGMSGSLACFRDIAPSYRRATTKWEIFDLWPSKTEQVRETHLCASWEVRPRGRGYRG